MKQVNRYRSCVGKVRFPNKESARKTMILLYQRGATRIHHYPCKFCGGRHIGHWRGYLRKR